MKIKSGEQLTFTIYRSDPTAVSATFIAQYESTVITDEVNYDSDGEAFFEFNSPETDVVGEYKVQINENFATGSPDMYPVGDCEDDCGFLKLEICESLPEGS